MLQFYAYCYLVLYAIVLSLSLSFILQEGLFTERGLRHELGTLIEILDTGVGELGAYSLSAIVSQSCMLIIVVLFL